MAAAFSPGAIPSQSPRLVAIQTSAAGVASDAKVEKTLKKRNPAKGGE
jgi:hypothetical protein